MDENFHTSPENDFEKVEQTYQHPADSTVDANVNAQINTNVGGFLDSQQQPLFDAGEGSKEPLVDLGFSSVSSTSGFKNNEPLGDLLGLESSPKTDDICEADVECAATSCTRKCVMELIYWRDPRKTGMVFGSILVILLSLAMFSIISVFAYLSLALLASTITFRLYKSILQAVQKSDEGHPFETLLKVDLAVSDDAAVKAGMRLRDHVVAVAVKLRNVVLVADLVESLKSGVFLWCLTYIGACFNAMTLIILVFVGIFTLPKVYEQYKPQIDQVLELAKARAKDALSKVQAKIPMLKKKEE